MFIFPEWLEFNAADMFDSAWTWFERVFGWIFTAFRTVLLWMFDIVTTILTQTPWWVWIIALALIYVFSYLQKKDIIQKKYWGGLLAVFVILLWTSYFNRVLNNPTFDIAFLDFLKLFLTRDNTVTPWWIYVVLVFLAAFHLDNWKLATVLAAMVFLIGAFGMWDQMTRTLSIIMIGVVLSFFIGLPLGILMAKIDVVEKILKPILDMMQTIPSFVYLIPAVMVFGTGRVAATFATLIYAIPPLIRLTYLGITNINEEVIEAGQSFGSTSMQMLFKIEIPQSLSTIATGLNQTTMMAVAMVVIAALVGAGGLGQEVITATNQIRIGQGFVGGFSIVFIAIILDRLMQALAKKMELAEGDMDG